MKQVLSKLRRAAMDYGMIQDGDNICAGVSGGKDSMLLLAALARYRLFSPQRFSLCAVCLDPGFGADYGPLEAYAQKLGVSLEIVPTQIGQIVFGERHEKNPCALCANLKRGALNNAAKALGCNKTALGHHADDLAETLMLSLLYEGRINAFKAVTHLDRKDLTVIRPLIYMREKDIVCAVNKNCIPFVKSNCPADGVTKRADMKQLIRKLSREIPHCDERIICAALPLLKNEIK